MSAIPTITRKFAVLILLAVIYASLPGCLRDPADKTQRILVWHSWSAPESELLTTLLDNYKKLFPKVHIVLEHVPLEKIQSRFDEQVQSGMGPDLFIGLEGSQICNFAEKDYLQELSGTSLDTTQINLKTLSALRLKNQLYAAPFSASTHVLYFNKDSKATVPHDLQGLITAAQQGRRIGIPLDFADAWWGIDAFNGRVLDSENHLDPNDGYNAWMQWLHKAQAENNIIFDSNYHELRDLFAKGELDYFIGKSREIPFFRDHLEAQGFGVSTLPSGVNKTPGGLLEVEAMAVNKYTTRLELAVDLMNYLTNVSSQRRVANGELGRIPINDGVRINPRLSPDAAALKRQEQRALTIPIARGNVQTRIFRLGSELNEQVVQGVLTPENSADEFFIRHAESVEPGEKAPAPDDNDNEETGNNNE